MTVQHYIDNINSAFKRGNATEHTYRGDLKQLIESIVTDVAATNEPKRQSCGAPDYILTKKDIPVGFIEAKDIADKDLEGTKKTGNKEQFDRYKASLNNLMFTDYLDFHLYRDGQFVTKIAIAEIQNGKIVSLPNNFSSFENLLKDFCTHISQSIKSSKKLAEMMAAKARMLAEVIDKALTSDEEHQEDSTLKDQMNAFKQILIHDIKPKEFADIYAQTIAYGMFAARLHDPTLPTFSRQEAAELIPKSNPFLRKLFGYIAGPDIDDRIKWIVDGLADVFRATDVATLLKDFGKATQTQDPIIHFYETFLSVYDPKLRKARGVWYTPEPVVNFIVRAVDDILKTEFDLQQGLADTSKTKIKVNLQATDKRYKDNVRTIEEEVHRVQILDPATGTGTFLSEVVKHIHKKFEGQEGIWSNYVENHLVPRLNGFELLMASYAMAHLKLDLLLTETGYKPKKEQRYKIFLTNSLEESHPDTGTLFANWLSAEANEANQIKRDTPVMCVIGNPPYAVSSTNKNPWIEKLISDYKKDLNEKSYNSLSDDYVKFIRFGQHFIDKNGSGILAYISNNSFIDGLVFRQMRKYLLESFDKIYILDLHGNAKKKEVCSDGSPDQNVFDIMQGVSINIFVKTGKKKKNELGEVFHIDLQGKREFKYEYLNENNLKSLKWSTLETQKPNYFFINKNLQGESGYNKGISINDLFEIKAAGIKTHRDAVVIGFNEKELKHQIENFVTTLQNSNIVFTPSKCKSLTYRPFDNRVIYYDTELVERHRQEQIKHSFGKNYSLVLGRQTKNKDINHFFISNTLSEMKTAESSTGSYHFQIYSYPDKNGQQTLGQTEERTPNFNLEIVAKIAKKIGLSFTIEKEKTKNTFAPIDVLDYIYAVLYSPTYREKYKELLKIDFPRVPYPKDVKTFWQLVKLGGEIRQIHLLESPTVEKYITQYPIDGDNVVSKIKFVSNRVVERFENSTSSSLDYSNTTTQHYTDNVSFPQPHLGSNESQMLHEPIEEYQAIIKGKVYINEKQYFDNVPEVAWNFYIGGYQPAQKWLKDRKERKLEFDDILHYQKIIVALTETDRLMKDIDKIEIE